VAPAKSARRKVHKPNAKIIESLEHKGECWREYAGPATGKFSQDAPNVFSDQDRASTLARS
jgi:hypothetical protein